MVLIVLTAMGVGIAVIVDQSPDNASTLPPPTSVPPPQPRPSAPASVPGWVAVTDDSATIAYDVPADWRVTYIGDGETLRAANWSLPVSMMASYLDGYCEATAGGSFRARSGTATIGDADATAAATDTARHVAESVYGQGTGVTLEGPRTITAHGHTGTLVTAHVTVHSTDRCEPATGLVDVYALAVPAKHDSIVAIAYADQQFTGAISQQDLDTIVTSFRHLPAH